MEILEEKAGQYVEKELITRAKADSILEIILGERGQGPEANPLGGADDEDGNATRVFVFGLRLPMRLLSYRV